MAINPYHTVEELNGMRCSIVEKKLNTQRAEFLKNILEFNGLEVVISAEADGSYVLGVTNILFNPINALYGRMLKTKESKIVSPSYWYNQKHSEGFYWEYKRS